ncbi:hypothetical protein PInf_004461 [Phytophthora infestans]|nr:hypothetical protein PInf_004461 [Phytophthora infestans]
MQQRNLLVFLVVAFAACVAVAEETTKGNNVNTASEAEARDRTNARRYLKSTVESFDPANEERLSFKLPGFNNIKSFFSKSTTAGAGMKNSPELATALKNPNVNKAFTEGS